MRTFFRLGSACAAFLLLIASALAQSKVSATTKFLLGDLARMEERGAPTAAEMERLAGRHALERKDGRYYVGAIALLGSEAFDEDELRARGVRIGSRLGDLVTLRIPVEELQGVLAHAGIRYLETGETGSPDLPLARKDTRADSVQLGLGGLDRAYRGSGVIVAVIDWGFDYTHPVFYDSTFTQLRISRAWDQNKLSGPTPAGYDFGTEYVGMAELLAAQQDTLYVFGPMSHGTHVAGIAAGNGGGTTNVGMAPEAELVLISLRRDAPSLVDAFRYLVDYAASVGKPLVVNMSFGNHRGPHDGTLLENQGMDALVGPGRVFVASAGNNGNANFHLRRDFTAQPDTIATVVNFGVGYTDMFGQALHMWGSANSSFSVALRIVSGSNVTLHETPFYSTAAASSVNDTLLIGANDTIVLRLEADARSVLNDKPSVQMEVRRTGNLKVVLLLASAGSEVHVWNVVRLNNRVTNWGVALGSNYPGAIGGDINYGIGEPGGVGRSVITVASHRAEDMTTGTMVYGALSGYSSRGPTVDGRTKPDISGPGEQVRSAVNSFDPANNSPVQSVSFNGRSYPFATYSGTSMSGPATAGVVALMLEADPLLHTDDAKRILRETARKDIRTGAIGPDGSLNWGWGKVDALAAVLATLQITSVPDVRYEPDDVLLYPNPGRGALFVEGMALDRARVFDLRGVLVRDHAFPPASAGARHSLPVDGLAGGTYLVELHGPGRVAYKKVVLE